MNLLFPLVRPRSSLFKACVRYFMWNFYFSPNDSPLKTTKNAFSSKSSFRSRDIQVCVFSSSPLFLRVSHCFTGWSKKNLKVYDFINGLNKNLITHFVWYLEKEITCDIEIRNIFIEQSCWKCTPKASPWCLFNFAK